MKIIFIGSGNVATLFARKLHDQNHDIKQVYSRSIANAEKLAQEINSIAIDNIDELEKDADAYFLCTSDDPMRDIVSHLNVNENALIIHTSGSQSMDILSSFHNYGVIYPLQTISKQRNYNSEELPLFIEASNQQSEDIVRELAFSISSRVEYMSSEKRLYLHLSAVFACNFVNAMYAMAGDVISHAECPFEILLPLINETAQKVRTLSPKQAQTGPALRNDETIIKKHELLLDQMGKHRESEIYRMMSNYIFENIGKDKNSK